MLLSSRKQIVYPDTPSPCEAGRGLGCGDGKETSEIMPPQIYSTLLTHFQQIFAAFCVFMTEICILLFFFVSNSKLVKLLITPNPTSTNRIQRNFDSNVAIWTFETSPASKHPRQKTNLLKPSSASLFLCFSVLSFYLLLFAEMLMAEVLRCFPQTESKENFCLITVYTHKNIF
jgi:hypothetical protein